MPPMFAQKNFPFHDHFFSISVIIPTLNAASTLRQSLQSVAWQNYPQNLIEIIIIDGGSSDQTLEIAREYQAKTFFNPLKTAESGKAIGIGKAQKELILLIDADNLLPTPDWLLKMTRPFCNPKISGAEPLRYVSRRQDSYINRYCALVGTNDPLCIFLGNYDRYNYLTRQWTEIDLKIINRQNYLEIQARGPKFPTMGANGFLARRQTILPYAQNDYFFDIDATYRMAVCQKMIFAKVDVGINHLFAPRLKIFFRKQKRRILDFLYFGDKKKKRIYPWRLKNNWGKIIKFSLYSFLIFPAFGQALKGYCRKRDSAWFFHPIACFLTLWIYGYYFSKMRIFGQKKYMDRAKW